MTQAKIKLFIVDRDSIFRLGLRTAIAQYADFEVVGEGNLSEDTLRELTQGMVLNVLVLGISYSSSSSSPKISSLELTQQLRQLYPQLPLFLLTPNFTTKQLAKLKSWGVKGNCDRSASINSIVEGLYTVAYGNSYWSTNDTKPRLWQQALANISQSGRIELEQTLREIEQKLANSNLSDWERVFLVGRQRELQSARWLSSRLVGEEIVLTENLTNLEPDERAVERAIVPIAPTALAPLPEFADSANKVIFERVVMDIQLGLNNRTKISLEIDLLQPEIAKSLCHLILQRLSETIAQIPIANTLDRDYTVYLRNLWQWSTNYFFRQYYGQSNVAEKQQLEEIYAQEFTAVQQNIFNDLYGIPELFDYLLGKPGLIIDNVVYQSDDTEAIARIEFLLHNLIIHLANGVMQVILNNFYDLEIFKYQLYQAEYRSDREIARFRNQLSWRYRQETYFTHPQNIFESRHRLFVINAGAIRTMYVYAPRKAELEKLTGIPWLSTIVIEIRDAIAPLVRKLIALAGSGVVFVLTQVIGKGLGLVGKGIIQGIGSTIKDVPRNKKKP
jgi:DNA-binding NarL/FixJ family response regulator